MSQAIKDSGLDIFDFFISGGGGFESCSSKTDLGDATKSPVDMYFPTDKESCSNSAATHCGEDATGCACTGGKSCWETMSGPRYCASGSWEPTEDRDKCPDRGVLYNGVCLDMPGEQVAIGDYYRTTEEPKCVNNSDGHWVSTPTVQSNITIDQKPAPESGGCGGYPWQDIGSVCFNMENCTLANMDFFQGSVSCRSLFLGPPTRPLFLSISIG